jgi:hypothetical protein
METISLGYFTQDCLPFVKMTLSKGLLWANRICILDMGSTDGTEEYCKSVLRPQDVYKRRFRNTIPTLGFDEAHNYLMGMADCSWAYVSGINMCLDWRQASLIRETISSTDKNVLEIETYHIPTPPDGIDWFDKMDELMEVKPTSIERHRNIIRRDTGIEFKGYEHEEPFFGEINAAFIAEKTNIRRFHYGNWLYSERKKMRDAWMLSRAMRVPEMKKYTNAWWYDTYYPQHEEELKDYAIGFEQNYPEEI